MPRTPIRIFASLSLAFCLVALLPLRAAAWGRDGHQIVAAIARARLTQLKARNALKNIDAILKPTPGVSILRQPRDLFEASLWPDNVRGTDEYGFADNLHFVSIELKKDGVPDKYVKSRNCKTSDEIPQVPEGVCIIGALEHYTRVLSDSSSTKAARIEALSFVVHFMGDLHQPLHTSEDKTFVNHLIINGQPGRGDRGGNHRFIFYLAGNAFESDDPESCLERENACTEGFPNSEGVVERSNRKLHAAWDKYMIQTEMRRNSKRPDFTTYADELFKQLPVSPADPQYAAIEAGDFVIWAEESHHVAELNAYELIGPKAKISAADDKEYSFFLLDDAYRRKNILIVDQQLIRAGIRLAAVLRKIFPES